MAKSDVLVRMKADTQNYDANIAKARRQLDAFRKDNLSMGGVLKQTSSSIVGLAARYASIGAAIGAVGAAFSSNIQTARQFEKSMSQLSSLTGKTGEDLNRLKEYAIELGSSTTLTASEVADAFKMIGSQQPQLLASSEALKSVTKQAITLSEAAGIDLATAAQTLSTSINQMGGDSENAARFVNVLAAASQKGAGDIAWLGEAVTKSGTTAKAVGTDYEELVANLEQLAKAGFDASTAGTALRSIIMNLEKQANSNFKPSVVGLTEAFENLGKANLSVTEYQKIAGKMFASQAIALANAADEAKRMTGEITGTNIAEEQAKTNTDNLDGSLKSLASAWEGLNLHLNNSNGLLKDVVDWLKDVVVWADKALQKLGAIPTIDDVIANNLPDVTDTVDDNGRIIRKPKPAPAPTPTPSPVGGGETTTKGHNSTTKVYTPGSIAYQEQLVQNLTKLWKEAGDGVRDQYVVQLVAAEQQLKKMNQEQELLKEQSQGKLLGGNIEMPGQANIAGSATELPPLFKGLDKADMPKMLSPLQQMNVELEHLKSLLETSPNSEAYQDTLDKIIKKQKEIDDFTGAGDKTAKSWTEAARAVGMVGNALSSLQDPSAQIASTVAMAIANIAMAYSETLAKDKTNKSNIWYFIATAAAAMVSMATTISSIHSATGYAQGGIVDGNQYSGDNVPIMANSGELILNRAQQDAVASAMEGNGMGNLNLRGVLSGENIVIAADRYLKRSGQGELAVWK